MEKTEYGVRSTESVCEVFSQTWRRLVNRLRLFHFMGHKVENTESVIKCFPAHGGDFYVEAKIIF